MVKDVSKKLESELLNAIEHRDTAKVESLLKAQVLMLILLVIVDLHLYKYL